MIDTPLKGIQVDFYNALLAAGSAGLTERALVDAMYAGANVKNQAEAVRSVIRCLREKLSARGARIRTVVRPGAPSVYILDVVGLVALGSSARPTRGRPRRISPGYWSNEETDILARGIYAGLSWADIGQTLPGRTMRAVRVHAAKLGIARKMAGNWPQIREDDPKERGHEKPDPLLAALAAAHTPSPLTRSHVTAHPRRIFSAIQTTSSVGSPAALCEGFA